MRDIKKFTSQWHKSSLRNGYVRIQIALSPLLKCEARWRALKRRNMRVRNNNILLRIMEYATRTVPFETMGTSSPFGRWGMGSRFTVRPKHWRVLATLLSNLRSRISSLSHFRTLEEPSRCACCDVFYRHCHDASNILERERSIIF